MGMEDDGYFRCVFTAVDDEGFEVLLDRIRGLGEWGKKGKGEKTGGEYAIAGIMEFPAKIRVKVVGPNEESFINDMMEIVKGVTEVENVGRRDNGKWTSISFDVEVENEEARRKIYKAIDRDDRVKFKL